MRRVAKKAATASWKSLAAEDLEGTSSTLPIGKCFWPLSQQEKRDIEKLPRINKCIASPPICAHETIAKKSNSLTPSIG